jgi:hypothetical protein
MKKMGIKRKLMNKMMPKEFGFISGLFHVSVFKLQAGINETLGRIGFHEYIFPAVKESMEKTEQIGIKPIKGETFEEFGNRFIEVLKDSLLVENAKLKKKSENIYSFSLDNCFMAKTSHKIAGDKGVCPMAMVVAAMLEKYTDKDVGIKYSNLTANGSITDITIS